MIRPGRNAVRRNRNIGTSKSGHGRDNRLVIPAQWPGDRIFWEKLRDPIVIRHMIGEREFVVLVEPVIKGYTHCCTPDDMVAMLEMVPPADLDELRVFVLRQPTRKEAVISPVWGRMAYHAELGSLSGPVVYLESQQVGQTWRQSKSMPVEDRQQFERFGTDGFPVEELSNCYRWQLTLEACRVTQLYRTLLHEIGHQRDFVVSVDRPGDALDVADPEWGALFDRYWARSHRDKEAFAHRYADELGARLRREGMIPFNRLADPDRLFAAQPVRDPTQLEDASGRTP